ncbi:transporter [Fulvivirga lutimaris]|uniref:transporter n=1 Tax=Fulvivirga lutimaris TaxID=1819566 RepID=UPI0012BC58BB|nr:transporter [Fulvivirga lutimaris]MTI38330.1 transporter [Fulvivirga lutimaris]
MRPKLTTILFLVLAAVSTINAQDDPIFTDRPNVTDAVAVIPRGVFQIEAGYLNDKLKFDDGSVTLSTLPNLSFKYGLSDRVELRLLTNYAKLDIKDDINSSEANGMTALTFSSKFALFEQLGAVPKTSLVANFTFPEVGAEAFRTEELNYGFRALFEYNFGRVAWTNSFGYDWLDFDSHQTTVTTVFSGSLTDKLGAFVEFYMIGSGEVGSINTDFGLSYLLTNRLQIDCIYGFDLYNDYELESASQRIVGFGFAWKTGN